MHSRLHSLHDIEDGTGHESKTLTLRTSKGKCFRTIRLGADMHAYPVGPVCHPPETKERRRELARRASLIRWGHLQKDSDSGS